MNEQVISVTLPKPAKVDTKLPVQFSDLQPFVSVWALGTETERNKQRHTIGMKAITDFGNALLPRVEEIVAFLDQFPIDDLPADGIALMRMLLSLAEVAPAIEFYKQPDVIDGYDPRRFIANESFVRRPAL